MKMIRTFILNIEKYLSIALLAAMLVGLTFQTISRYFFHHSTAWMEEMCGYGLLCLVFLSASYAVQHDAHMRVDSVTLLYPKKLAPFIEILGELLWMVFALILTYLGVEYAATAFAGGQRAISVPILLGIIYSALPLGYGCMAIRLLVKIIQDFRRMITGSPEREATKE